MTGEIKAKLCCSWLGALWCSSVLFFLGEQRWNLVCTNRRTCCEIRDTVGICTKEHVVNVNVSLGISPDIHNLL